MSLLTQHKNVVSGDSKFQINIARQARLRLPSYTSPKEVKQQSHDYTLVRIGNMVVLDSSDYETSEFVDPRRLICSRLTL